MNWSATNRGAGTSDPRTRHELPCGRSVEQVWDEHGRPRVHLDCPHCATARRSLEQLAEATRMLVDDPAEPASDLLGRIMAAVRAELAPGEVVALPAPGVDVSVPALAAVLRFAADGVDGVRAHRCRIVARADDVVDVTMTVSLRYGSGRVQALADVRRRIGNALASRIGLRLGVLDLEVGDVWLDGDAQ